MKPVSAGHVGQEGQQGQVKRGESHCHEQSPPSQQEPVESTVDVHLKRQTDTRGRRGTTVKMEAFVEQWQKGRPREDELRKVKGRVTHRRAVDHRRSKSREKYRGSHMRRRQKGWRL